MCFVSNEPRCGGSVKHVPEKVRTVLSDTAMNSMYRADGLTAMMLMAK